jgi:hypothetical protein
MPMPDLDLDVRAKPAAKPRPRKEVIEDMPLELAIDPRALVQERTDAQGSFPPAQGTSQPPRGQGSPQHGALQGKRPTSLAPPANDLEGDAIALAEYGDAPGTWVTSPLYAWRVLKRQRELKTALAVRTAEAEHAQTALDDALVAFGERARAAAEKHKDYLVPVEELGRAEEQLRSRDRVLAAEQDAQRARLAQVDARVAKAESELAGAQGNERAAATELAGAQGALAREEAKIKRAEVELRNAQQRPGDGGSP